MAARLVTCTHPFSLPTCPNKGLGGLGLILEATGQGTRTIHAQSHLRTIWYLKFTLACIWTVSSTHVLSDMCNKCMGKASLSATPSTKNNITRINKSHRNTFGEKKIKHVTIRRSNTPIEWTFEVTVIPRTHYSERLSSCIIQGDPVWTRTAPPDINRRRRGGHEARRYRETASRVQLMKAIHPDLQKGNKRKPHIPKE